MEVLTIQLGHFSNFIGTHFWNFQSNQLVQELNHSGNVFATYNPLVAEDASDPNILCRETCDKYGRRILVPRLLAIDLKGSLNRLKKDGTVGEEEPNAEEFATDNLEVMNFESQSKLMDSPSEMESEETVSKSATETVWSDFLASQYHPKSIFLLEGYSHNSEVDKFTNYGVGMDTVKNINHLDDLEDRLHYFLEECDSPQGLQVIADFHNGFGGYSSGLLDQFHDIAGKLPIYVFGNWPVNFNSQFMALNSSLSLSSISSQGDLLFPLSLKEKIAVTDTTAIKFHHMDIKESSYYETSAIHASFIDNMTLPFRTKKSNATTMNGLASFVTIGSQHVVASGLCLPLTTSSFQPGRDHGNSEAYLTNLTPDCSCSRYRGSYGELLVLRGRTRMERVLAKLSQLGSHTIKTQINEEFQWIFDQTLESYTTKRFCFDSCQSTAMPFPQVFQPSLSGDAMATESKVGSEGFTSVSSVSKVAPSRSLYDLFFNLYMQARLVSRPHLVSFLQGGLELGDVRESLEQLLCLAESYDPSRRDFNDVDTRAFKF